MELWWYFHGISWVFSVTIPVKKAIVNGLIYGI